MGFYSDEEISKEIPNLAKKYGCLYCKLRSRCKHPEFKVIGKGKKNILLVFPSPSKRMDASGEIRGSEQYILVKKQLRKYDIDIHKDCHITFAFRCYDVENNKKKTESYMLNCRSKLNTLIYELAPRVIVAFGTMAFKSLVYDRVKKSRLDVGIIDKWRGQAIPDQELKAWVIPMWEPKFIIKENKNPMNYKKFFSIDFFNIKKHWDIKVPNYTDNKEVIIIKKERSILNLFKDIKHIHVKKKNFLLVFDYETTGLSPYKKGHKIVSMSLCFNKKETYSFMMPKEGGKALEKWKYMLSGIAYFKGAHNYSFESMWTKHLLGVNINNFFWDSMINAHILDNRKGITGLKYQTYANFGQLGWDSVVDPFLKSKNKKDSHSFNRIEECDEDTLLYYGGLDSYYQYMLSMKQIELMNIRLPRFKGKL